MADKESIKINKGCDSTCGKRSGAYINSSSHSEVKMDFANVEKSSFTIECMGKLRVSNSFSTSKANPIVDLRIGVVCLSNVVKSLFINPKN
jgi:hypothetical protein